MSECHCWPNGTLCVIKQIALSLLCCLLVPATHWSIQSHYLLDDLLSFRSLIIFPTCHFAAHGVFCRICVFIVLIDIGCVFVEHIVGHYIARVFLSRKLHLLITLWQALSNQIFHGIVKPLVVHSAPACFFALCLFPFYTQHNYLLTI